MSKRNVQVVLLEWYYDRNGQLFGASVETLNRQSSEELSKLIASLRDQGYEISECEKGHELVAEKRVVV